jgi:hypothetical protein
MPDYKTSLNFQDLDSRFRGNDKSVKAILTNAKSLTFTFTVW